MKKGVGSGVGSGSRSGRGSGSISERYGSWDTDPDPHQKCQGSPTLCVSLALELLSSACIRQSSHELTIPLKNQCWGSGSENRTGIILPDPDPHPGPVDPDPAPFPFRPNVKLSYTFSSKFRCIVMSEILKIMTANDADEKGKTI